MLDTAMDALRCPPGEQDVATLSGGERRRVALCRLLLSSPDLLLLDEPTNHLDAESVAWLERFLERYRGTVIAVTHDRYFLDNVAGWILELDRGRGIPFQGNYSSWLEQKQARLAAEEKQESARRRTLARELEWVRTSPKARHDKSKARLASYEKLLAEEQNVKLDRIEIHIPAGPRLGDVVVEADHVAKGFGDRLLVEDMTFSLPPGGIVGVIGPNGAGKTTLFRMIAGEELPDAGPCASATLSSSPMSTRREPTWSRGTPSGRRSPAVTTSSSWGNERSTPDSTCHGSTSGAGSAEARFRPLRRGAEPRSPREAPQGGRQRDPPRRTDERPRRRHPAGGRGRASRLCRLCGRHLARPLVLDRIATHILAFEGDSQTAWYEGSYQEYEEYRRALLGAEADQPHRIKFKPLVRS